MLVVAKCSTENLKQQVNRTIGNLSYSLKAAAQCLHGYKNQNKVISAACFVFHQEI